MGLKVWLPLNGDLRNLGTSNGNFSIKTALTYTDNGKIGKACSGGTITMNANTTASILNNQEFSFTCWVYINSAEGSTSNRAMFFGNSSTGANNNRKFSIFQYPTCNDLHLSWMNDTETSTFVSKIWNDVLPSYKWTHIAVTYKNPNVTIYINGIKYATWSGISNSSSFKYETYLFQNAPNQTRYLNDYRVYDECLSAAQIHEIAKGLVLHYKLDGPMSGSGKNLLRNTNFFKTATNSSPASTTISPAITFAENLQNLVGKTITFSFELYTPGARQNNPSQSNAILAERFGAHLSLNYTPSGGSATQLYPCANYLTSTINEPNKRVVQTYTVPSNCTINSFGIAIQPYAYPAADNPATWKIGQFKVEYGDKATSYSPAPEDLSIDTTIVTDSSGYEHSGTITGTLITSSDTPRYSSAINLNGSTSIIRTDSFTSEIYTLTCWAKTTKNKATSQIMVADSLSQMCISFYNNAIISFYGTNGGQGTGSRCTLGNEYKENDWNFFAVVKSGTSGERDVYCNGVKLTPTSNSWWTPANGFWIGNRQNGGDAPFYGYISDVRAYCTPLLDTDIKLLYNVDSRIDNLGGIHTYEANENDNNIVSKITEVGQLKSKNIYEQTALLNNATSASYNPNGNSNSCLPYVLWADFTPFYQLGQSIRVQVEADIAWSNITPTEGGTFKSRLQGGNYIAETHTWGWTTSPTQILSNYDFTSLMTANATGSVHVSYERTVPAAWLEQNLRSQFGLRTDYATGTISISNLKITLIPGTAKINTSYVSGTEIIEM